MGWCAGVEVETPSHPNNKIWYSTLTTDLFGKAHNSAGYRFEKLAKKHGLSPTGVLQLGTNQAQEIAVFLRMGFKNIVTVEANPELYRTEVRRTMWYWAMELYG